jgi:hypothetical protein
MRHNQFCRIAFCAVLCLSATAARADILELGTLSYDTFIPESQDFPGVDAFNISNLTGAFSLPPSFPALDNLTFQAATLTLFSSGQAPQLFSLGDIAPGFLLDQFGNPIIQVPGDETFQSAEFTATLSASSILEPGGTFTAGSNAIDVFLLPSQGPDLTPDDDQTTISVTGQMSTPEPASWSLLLIVFAWVAWTLRKRRFSRSTPQELL